MLAFIPAKAGTWFVNSIMQLLNYYFNISIIWRMMMSWCKSANDQCSKRRHFTGFCTFLTKPKINLDNSLWTHSFRRSLPKLVLKIVQNRNLWLSSYRTALHELQPSNTVSVCKPHTQAVGHSRYCHSKHWMVLLHDIKLTLLKRLVATC